MSQDAHRLSILTTKEIDALYGLPRFTAQERQLYFDVSPPERAAVDAHTPAVAVHLTLQLGYFKANRQFFPYDAETVSEDLRYICARYFPGKAFELVAVHSALPTHPPGPTADHPHALRLSPV